MKKELLKGLSEEQIERLKKCKNSDEILAFAKEEGIELSDEQLEAINGGCGDSAPDNCPQCGSDKIYWQITYDEFFDFDYFYKCKCRVCGHEWEDK